MVALNHNGHLTPLPTGWNDAGPRAWAMLRALARRPPGAGKLEAIRLLAGLDRGQLRRLTDEDVVTLDLCLPWLSASPLAEPLRRSLWVRGRRYSLPKKYFEDGACITYAYAEEYYERAVQQGDADAPLLLLATLAMRYRRGKPVPLLERFEIEARARRFRRVPPEYALHALMYWAGVRETVDGYYGDHLFRGSPLDKPPLLPIPSAGWWSIFQDVAEGGVFGDLDAVYVAPFHDVAAWLNRKEGIRRAQQLEMENMRNKK